MRSTYYTYLTLPYLPYLPASTSNTIQYLPTAGRELGPSLNELTARLLRSSTLVHGIYLVIFSPSLALLPVPLMSWLGRIFFASHHLTSTEATRPLLTSQVYLLLLLAAHRPKVENQHMLFSPSVHRPQPAGFLSMTSFWFFIIFE